MKTIITLLLALASFAVHADESQWSLQLHGLSWHAKERSAFDRTGRQWNERNYGGGLRYAFDDTWSVQAGAYHNSIDKLSAYALVDWTPVRAGTFSLGVFAGGVTGYNSAPVVAAAGLVARKDFGKFSATWRAMPPIPKQSPFTVVFEVGIKL